MVLSSFVAGCGPAESLRPPAPEPCPDPPAGGRRGRKVRLSDAGQANLPFDRTPMLASTSSSLGRSAVITIDSSSLTCTPPTIEPTITYDSIRVPRRGCGLLPACRAGPCDRPSQKVRLILGSPARPGREICCPHRRESDSPGRCASTAHVPSVEHTGAVADPGAREAVHPRQSASAIRA